MYWANVCLWMLVPVVVFGRVFFVSDDAICLSDLSKKLIQVLYILGGNAPVLWYKHKHTKTLSSFPFTIFKINSFVSTLHLKDVKLLCIYFVDDVFCFVSVLMFKNVFICPYLTRCDSKCTENRYVTQWNITSWKWKQSKTQTQTDLIQFTSRIFSLILMRMLLWFFVGNDLNSVGSNVCKRAQVKNLKNNFNAEDMTRRSISE